MRALDGSLPAVPRLDALDEGYEVYPVTDAVGGTSPEAHLAALERMVHAGVKPRDARRLLRRQDSTRNA